MEHRYLPMENMTTREEGDELYLEGYFAVFNGVYELWPGATESIAPGAFDDSVGDDVRALFNHNTDLVLGRTSAGTLELRQDAHGLWGRVKINREDTDAMNAYRRIARGDITGCSFGFDVAAQETDYRDDGTVHWTLTRISPLYEVSPCTSPPTRIPRYPPGSGTWTRSSGSGPRCGSTRRWSDCMVLSETARKAIEAILSKGERVELVPVKDGVKIYEVKRREAAMDTN